MAEAGGKCAREVGRAEFEGADGEGADAEGAYAEGARAGGVKITSKQIFAQPLWQHSPRPGQSMS